APAGAGAAETRAAVDTVLGALRARLAGEQLTDTPLVVVTGSDPAGAAVGGLVRSAQSENPGRVVLVEAAEEPDAERLAEAVATGEPHLAFRDGAWRVPRLTRVTENPPATGGPDSAPHTDTDRESLGSGSGPGGSGADFGSGNGP
ncbi:hypothetical protein, partial [Streptomyces sp. SID161]|uniref:SpnB-like Rossmann fold domain-containing protein n=1 Tax=Streptomyces sp. SID161 TaxID=2690251 RepID=UPI001F36685B